MPKQLAVEYECERCDRVWYAKYEDGQDPPDSASLCGLTLFSAGSKKPTREITFNTLCDSCYQTVINLVDSMDKLKKKSPKPRAKKGAPKGAAPKPAEKQAGAAANAAPTGAARSTGSVPSTGR